MCIGVAPPKRDNPHPLIAREGWPFLAASVAVSAGAAWWGGWWSLPLWLVSLFILQFFRDPPRLAPEGANLVLAPADGKVIAVERVRDPYLDREAHKVSIFMNVFNVHSNRSPVDGVVEEVWYQPGKFLNADLSKASLENERNALWLRTEGGWDVTCVQVAGLIARRILCYAREGDWLKRGQRYGFIRFGSRLDVYLPLVAHVRVSIGDRVRAGEAILADLPYSTG
jgi:phosphatidylserine decarboxylase